MTDPQNRTRAIANPSQTPPVIDREHLVDPDQGLFVVDDPVGPREHHAVRTKYAAFSNSKGGRSSQKNGLFRRNPCAVRRAVRGHPDTGGLGLDVRSCGCGREC